MNGEIDRSFLSCVVYGVDINGDGFDDVVIGAHRTNHKAPGDELRIDGRVPARSAQKEARV